MREAAADGVQRVQEALLCVGPPARRPGFAAAQRITVSNVPVTGLASLLLCAASAMSGACPGVVRCAWRNGITSGMIVSEGAFRRPGVLPASASCSLLERA